MEDGWAQWDTSNEPDCVLTYQDNKKPCDIKEHIEIYRQQTMAAARKASDDQTSEPEANYFQVTGLRSSKLRITFLHYLILCI